MDRKHHYQAKESEVIVNPGGRFGVYMALATTVKEGESAIVIEPELAGLQGGPPVHRSRAITVPTTLEEGWEPSVDADTRRDKTEHQGDNTELPREPDGGDDLAGRRSRR